MSDALGGPARASGARPAPAAVYVRIVGLLLLAAGLARAAQILGMTPDRSDFASLSVPWRAGAATLFLLDVFAAVGLWVGAAWGAIAWAVAAVVEVSMYTLFPDLFGHHPWRVAAHGVLFALFLVLVFLDWRRSLSE